MIAPIGGGGKARVAGGASANASKATEMAPPLPARL